jgi:hypothetical protein
VTSRLFIKCQVCGAVTLIRVQVGWLDHHPVSVPCGKCGITLSGTAHFDQVKATAHYEFPNADEIEETHPSFYLEVSGEFVTDKLREYSGGPFIWSPPPFFQALWAMGQNGNAEFKSKTLQFLQFARNDWHKVKRINELWLGGQHHYLSSELRQYLPNPQFPLNNPLEYLRGVHQLNLLLLWPILDHARFKRTTDFLFRAMPQMVDANRAGFLALLTFFEEANLLQSYEWKILTCLESFALKFRYLIPLFSLRFYAARLGLSP